MGAAAGRLMAATAVLDAAPVDLSIEIAGGPLPRDHALDVWHALLQAVPVLADEQTLAILPVRAAADSDGRLVLQRRSRLLMRLVESAVDGVLALSGRQLDIAGAPVAFGTVKTRPLTPHATLYAQRVAAERDDEADFVRQVTAGLSQLGMPAEFIVGRRSQARGPSDTVVGFSLMLANLSSRQSLLLQSSGLGAHRRLGFGIFVGHK